MSKRVIKRFPARKGHLLPEVMTLEELAAYLRVSRSTIYRGVRAGQFPAFKVGRNWRVNLRLVEDHLIGSYERKTGRKDEIR
jgi:excisionase family DNA binding protein